MWRLCMNTVCLLMKINVLHLNKLAYWRRYIFSNVHYLYILFSLQLFAKRIWKRCIQALLGIATLILCPEHETDWHTYSCVFQTMKHNQNITVQPRIMHISSPNKWFSFSFGVLKLICLRRHQRTLHLSLEHVCMLDLTQSPIFLLNSANFLFDVYAS